MKRSGQVGLVLMTALGLASCGRGTPTPAQRPVASEPPPVVASPSPALTTAAPSESQATMTWDNKPRDPCAQQYFDEDVCQQAITNRGYHYGGTWIPVLYGRTYSSYYSDHTAYVSSGGNYQPTPTEVYDPKFKAPAAGEVVRGGFGKTAAAIRSSGSSSISSHSGSGSSSAAGE